MAVEFGGAGKIDRALWAAKRDPLFTFHFLDPEGCPVHANPDHEHLSSDLAGRMLFARVFGCAPDDAPSEAEWQALHGEADRRVAEERHADAQRKIGYWRHRRVYRTLAGAARRRVLSGF